MLIFGQMKRLIDFLFSLSGLIVLSPLFLSVSILVQMRSPGPIFHRGKRIGKNGKPFFMYKFRSMIEGAEEIGGPSTASDEPRLTKMGKFLKNFQLDELPQLINVLKGEMSLVGPRPEVSLYVDMMREEERRVILSVKPGMTDLASLWNFHEGEILKGSLNPEKTYLEKIRPEKIRLQMEYVKNRSFWLDLKILLKNGFSSL